MKARAIAVIGVLGCLALGSATPLSAQKRRGSEGLLHHRLSAEYSQWLVGPISWMATPDEIDGFLALRADEEAAEFIEPFWLRRDPDPSREGNPPRELFERRAARADDDYSEVSVAGRRTDRGTIFILYGPAESSEYEELRDVSEPDVELWKYPKKAQEGLDGKRPARRYRFARRGDVATFYRPRDPTDIRNRLGREPQPPRGGGFPDQRPSRRP